MASNARTWTRRRPRCARWWRRGPDVLRIALPIAALALLALAGCKSETTTLSGEAIVSDTPWPASEEAHYRLMDGDEVQGDGLLRITSVNGLLTLRQEFESEEFKDTVEAVVDGVTMEPESVQRAIDGPDGERRWEG